LVSLLAARVTGEQVEQRAGLFAAQVRIERAAGLGVLDGHGNLRPVQRIRRSWTVTGIAAALALFGVSRWL
jgi:hypothetical protein